MSEEYIIEARKKAKKNRKILKEGRKQDKKKGRK